MEGSVEPVDQTKPGPPVAVSSKESPAQSDPPPLSCTAGNARALIVTGNDTAVPQELEAATVYVPGLFTEMLLVLCPVDQV
jgi:hypothetical protein